MNETTLYYGSMLLIGVAYLVHASIRLVSDGIGVVPVLFAAGGVVLVLAAPWQWYNGQELEQGWIAYATAIGAGLFLVGLLLGY